MKKRDLLKRIEALEAENAALRFRVGMLEARPVTWPPAPPTVQVVERPQWEPDTNKTVCDPTWSAPPTITVVCDEHGAGVYSAENYRVRVQ